MTKIKICGITRDEDVDYVNALHPDYIGFVFTSKSRRFVSSDRAAALRAKLRPEIFSVGVFVDSPLDLVVQLVELKTIDIVQLHGNEDEAYIETLRNRIEVPLIQAFRATSTDDLAKAKASLADFVLLDNGAGGTGKTFDWRIARDFTRPFFLAGGLNPDNIAQAIELLSPYAVDVSSGVEVDGHKDFEKIREVVFQVRKHERLA